MPKVTLLGAISNQAKNHRVYPMLFGGRGRSNLASAMAWHWSKKTHWSSCVWGASCDLPTQHRVKKPTYYHVKPAKASGKKNEKHQDRISLFFKLTHKVSGAQWISLLWRWHTRFQAHFEAPFFHLAHKVLGALWSSLLGRCLTRFQTYFSTSLSVAIASC